MSQKSRGPLNKYMACLIAKKADTIIHRRNVVVKNAGI